MLSRKEIDVEVDKVLNGLNSLEELILNEYGLSSKEKERINTIKNDTIFHKLGPFLKELDI